MGRKAKLITNGVYDRAGVMRVEIGFESNGTRRFIKVGEYTQAEAARWAEQRLVINQQIRFNRFRWQDWFTPEQWGKGEATGNVLQGGATWKDCAALVADEMTECKEQSRDSVALRVRRWSSLDERRMASLKANDLHLAWKAAGMPSKSANYKANVLSAARKVVALARANDLITILDHALLMEKLNALAPKRRVTKSVRPTLTVKQIDAVLGWMFDRDHALYANWFELMLFSGLRPAEGRALEWSDVNLAAGTISVTRAKAGKYAVQAPKTPSSVRIIRMLPRAVEALRRQQAVTGLAGLVFRHPVTGGYINPYAAADGRNSAANVWYEALAACGIPKMVPYSARHSYATNLHNAGLDDRLLASQLGHSSTRTLHQTYAHFNHRADDFRKIDEAAASLA